MSKSVCPIEVLGILCRICIIFIKETWIIISKPLKCIIIIIWLTAHPGSFHAVSMTSDSLYAEAFCLLRLANHSSLLSAAMACERNQTENMNAACKWITGFILYSKLPYPVTHFPWGPLQKAAWMPHHPQSRSHDHPTSCGDLSQPSILLQTLNIQSQ